MTWQSAVPADLRRTDNVPAASEAAPSRSPSAAPLSAECSPLLPMFLLQDLSFLRTYYRSTADYMRGFLIFDALFPRHLIDCHIIPPVRLALDPGTFLPAIPGSIRIRIFSPCFLFLCMRMNGPMAKKSQEQQSGFFSEGTLFLGSPDLLFMPADLPPQSLPQSWLLLPPPALSSSCPCIPHNKSAPGNAPEPSVF